MMPQQRGPRLSLAEWLVLCLVSEEPTHGFAIAGLLAHDGSLGQVWHVPRQVVYRAARRLEHLGLITVSEKQPSRLGPDKAQLQATPAGRQAAGRWLRESAGHPRDIRSELLVKLALLDRAGG
jgi:DNA-binding PadR family transcriptional regulator